MNYSKTCSTSRGICMSATLCKYNNQSFVFSPNQIQTQITGAEIRVTQNIEDDNYTTREREKSFFFFFYQTIHTTRPTNERRKQRKAKGRPNRKPNGLQSSSELHIPWLPLILFFCFSSSQKHDQEKKDTLYYFNFPLSF